MHKTSMAPGKFVTMIPQQNIYVQKRRYASAPLIQHLSPKASRILPLFCCNQVHQVLKDKVDFADFSNAATQGIQLIGSQIEPRFDHLVQVIVYNPKLETSSTNRFFVCLNPAQNYREVDKDFCKLFTEKENIIFTFEAVIECPEHKRAFQLSRFDNTEESTEGIGVKEPEPSPLQIAKEKRRAWARKISYGRREEIDAAIRRISYGNPQEIRETDFQLARLSLYLAESRFC